MPGLHFVHSPSGGISQRQLMPSLDRLLHDQRYRAEAVYHDDRVFLGVTRYPEYPVVVFENEDYRFLLEGRLYGVDPIAVAKEIYVLADSLFTPDNRSRQVGDWLATHDGDYVIIGRQKRSGGWALVNDCLGRLPVYYCRHDGTVYLSRELRFIAGQLPAPTMDRMALGHYLLVGFPLGTRTLLAGVDRLPAGSLIRFGSGAEDGPYQTICRFNFDETRPVTSRREMTEGLAERFVAACADVADPDGGTVVSLSGGLDSRTVAAGLVKAGRRFRAVTFDDAHGEASADVVYAREVASKLGFNWESIPLAPSRGADVKRFLRMKGGMNSIGLAFYLSFLGDVGQRYGNGVIYLTGDGGDKVLPDLTPPGKLSSSSRLARFIVDRHDILHIDQVARLVRLSASDIVGEIESVVDAYPEQSPDRKYVHFLIYERGMKWLFEGEDRNRCLLWSATPFYRQSFFREAMSCPMEFKKNRQLYREFLTYLSPIAAGVIDSNKGMPITASSYGWEEAAFDLLARFPSLSRRLKSRLWPPRSYRASSPALLCLRRQAEQSRAVGEYIDSAELMRLIATPASLSRSLVDNLVTVTGAIELYSCARESLDDFQDVEFI